MRLKIKDYEREFLFEILPGCYRKLSWRKFNGSSTLGCWRSGFSNPEEKGWLLIHKTEITTIEFPETVFEILFKFTFQVPRTLTKIGSPYQYPHRFIFQLNDMYMQTGRKTGMKVIVTNGNKSSEVYRQIKKNFKNIWVVALVCKFCAQDSKEKTGAVINSLFKIV